MEGGTQGRRKRTEPVELSEKESGKGELMTYEEFLQSKETKYTDSGFDISVDELNDKAFDFQKDITKWALKKGKSAIFADCGLGKTEMQLDFANQVYMHTGLNVLIVAPLAVSKQTKQEGEKFGINVTICRTQNDVKNGVNITNYEMLEHFEASKFSGVVLDESSILKSFTGKTKQEIIDKFKYTPYRLACTATPAPNDFMELGNHAEFLGIMSRTEMLATYFVHDGGDTAKWRLKGHAENDFWNWIATWAVVIKSPSDLGYASKGYDLPELNLIEHILPGEVNDYELIVKAAETLQERREARKGSLESRVELAAEIVNNSDENWLVWCDFNLESEALSKAINNSVEVKGSDKPEHKETAGVEFAQGTIKSLVSKASIYGFGMNWQNCHNIIFCGLSDSYEQFYQAVRRCWRFGQTKEVNVHIIISEKETNVLENIKRKGKLSDAMAENMVNLTKEVTISEIRNTTRITTKYEPKTKTTKPDWLKGA